MLLKFLKFGVVGLSGLLIDFSTTYFFKEIIKLHRYFASSIGFVVAATSNYLLNRIWTFHSSNPHIVYEYSSFLLISFFGLLINNLFLFLFEIKLDIKFYKAKFLAILVTVFWNFFMNYFFTFTYLET